MKFGIFLPSLIYNQQRGLWAQNAFRTLRSTRTDGLDRPRLTLYLGKPKVPFQYELAELDGIFDLVVSNFNFENGSEQIAAYGMQQAYDHGADYIVSLTDDTLFNSQWLLQLKGLIERHPDARCWSVHHSAYAQEHKTLREQDGDVMVTSMPGHGFTISRQEWEEWGVNWRDGEWPTCRGDTLDLHHLLTRPGERWVTAKSYIEHTGKTGQHCFPNMAMHGIDFCGEG